MEITQKMKFLFNTLMSISLLIFSSCNNTENRKNIMEDYCGVGSAIIHFNKASQEFGEKIKSGKIKISQQQYTKEDMIAVFDSILVGDEKFLPRLDSVINELSKVPSIKSQTQLQENTLRFLRELRNFCNKDVKYYLHLKIDNLNKGATGNYDQAIATLKELMSTGKKMNDLQVEFQEEFKLTDDEIQNAMDCASK
jgi:hypothetical protein